MISTVFILFTLSNGNCAEIDDSAVFIDAFNAYQQKDYLLTIEKCDQLNNVFPDSPLRDVTLLLTARASLKSGDNKRAAMAAALFLGEFPESSLKTSVEDELKTLVNHYQKGESIAPNKILLAAANKVRTDRLARERAAELKMELERRAKAKADQERLVQIQLQEERREKERLKAEKLAKASIKAAIIISQDSTVVSVGSNGTLPFEISNRGKNSEEFMLSVTSTKEYGAIITKVEKPIEKIDRILLSAGETFKGLITFRMPSEMVDGHRSTFKVKAISSKFNDIAFQKDVVILSSAPLVRAVGKLSRQKVTPGEKLHYRLTVLNAGSLSAQNLTIRLQLPPEIDFQGAPDVLFKQEPNGTLVFKIDSVGIGKLTEINLDVKIRENSAPGKQLRAQVEVVNGELQRKDIFTASASIVEVK